MILCINLYVCGCHVGLWGFIIFVSVSFLLDVFSLLFIISQINSQQINICEHKNIMTIIIEVCFKKLEINASHFIYTKLQNK